MGRGPGAGWGQAGSPALGYTQSPKAQTQENQALRPQGPGHPLICLLSHC